MNAISLRRRWLTARPWFVDGTKGLALVGMTIGFMWMIGHLAMWCQAWGVCA